MRASGKQIFALIAGCCIIVAAVFLLLTGQGGQLLLRAWPPVMGGSQEAVRRIPEKTVSPGPAQPATQVNAQDQKRSAAKQLNDEGVALIQKNQLWEGVFCLEKALRLDPSNIASLLNMATVLADMGLTAPAERYLERARAIDPQNPHLRENFPEILQPGPYNPARKDGMFPSTEIIEPVAGEGGSTAQGVRLWQDEMLHLWGMDGYEVYDLH